MRPSNFILIISVLIASGVAENPDVSKDIPIQVVGSNLAPQLKNADLTTQFSSAKKLRLRGLAIEHQKDLTPVPPKITMPPNLPFLIKQYLATDPFDDESLITLKRFESQKTINGKIHAVGLTWLAYAPMQNNMPEWGFLIARRGDGARDDQGMLHGPAGQQDPGETVEVTGLREGYEELIRNSFNTNGLLQNEQAATFYSLSPENILGQLPPYYDPVKPNVLIRQLLYFDKHVSALLNLLNWRTNNQSNSDRAYEMIDPIFIPLQIVIESPIDQIPDKIIAYYKQKLSEQLQRKGCSDAEITLRVSQVKGIMPGLAREGLPRLKKLIINALQYQSLMFGQQDVTSDKTPLRYSI